MNEWIANDEYSKTPMPKLKVVTKVSKWTKYECIEKNGVKYIRGYEIEKNNELFEYKEMNNASVLFALMDVANKLTTVIDSNHFFVNEHITDTDINVILKFCRSYGLPFWNSRYTVDYYTNEDYPDLDNAGQSQNKSLRNSPLMRSILSFAPYNIMPVASFIIGVHSLQTDFLKVALYNKWNEDINIGELISNVPQSRLDHVRSIVKKRGLDLYFPSLVSFDTYWNSELFSLALNCENLFHLSIYYLCILAQTSDYTGGYIRKCKKCDALFVANNSRQQFCNNPCTRQSYYSMKKRNDK